MREIKFRVWEPNKGKYATHDISNMMNVFTGELGYFDEDKKDCFGRYNDGSYILEQYTGLKDKNGVEIYEGDIVKLTATRNDYHQRGATSFGHVGFAEAEFNYCPFLDEVLGHPLINGMLFSTIEVVSNIHENPDLLADRP